MPTEDNPFFAESKLPLKYPPFDKIKDEHFGPAMDRGMADQLKEIDAIANDPAPPTFDNTIVALEKSGQILDRSSTVFFSLVGADTSDVRKKIQSDYAPRLSAHSDSRCSPWSRPSATRSGRTRSTWRPSGTRCPTCTGTSSRVFVAMERALGS
jgi:hypothetical protein